MHDFIEYKGITARQDQILDPWEINWEYGHCTYYGNKDSVFRFLITLNLFLVTEKKKRG